MEKKMIEEITKPDQLKIIKLDDMINYYKKIDKNLTKELLYKEGFYDNEIKWMKKHYNIKFDTEPEEYIYIEKYKQKRHKEHVVKKEYLDNIWNIIKTQTKNKDKKTTYRNIIQQIIKDNKIDIDIEAFNGGRNRAKYYFKLYYYPIKVLEAQNKIKYKKGFIIKK